MSENLEDWQQSLDKSKNSPIISSDTHAVSYAKQSNILRLHGASFMTYFKTDGIRFSTNCILIRSLRTIVRLTLSALLSGTSKIQNMPPDASFLNLIISSGDCFFHVDRKVSMHSIRIWKTTDPHEQNGNSQR